MTVAVTARTAGKVMLNIIADRLITTINQNVQPGLNLIRVPVGRDWAMVVMCWRRCCGRSMSRRSACRAVPSGCNGSRSIARQDARGQSPASAAVAASQTLRVPVKIDGLAGQEARLVWRRSTSEFST